MHAQLLHADKGVGNMKRLTEQIKNKETGEVLAYRLHTEVDRIRAYRKLGEYEDLEEQGLLLRLPCKVGDYVWDLLSGYRFEVVGIELHPNGWIIFRCGNKGTEDYASFYLDEIGERWSLSEPQSKTQTEKPQSEKALAEMG